MTLRDKKKPLTNRKAPGRKRRRVTYDDFVKEPTLTMEILADLKNEGHSWRTLADEVNTALNGRSVSHTLVRLVTLGHCDSEIVDYALGVQDSPPPVTVKPCKCGDFHAVPWCTKEKGDPLPPPAPKPKRAPRPKRWRHHYECGRGDEGATVDAEIRAEMEAAGCDSFTQYVNWMRGKVNDG